MTTQLSRREIVLAGMAPAKGAVFQPVHIQKLFFLIDKKVAKDVGGPHFNFQPYDYGPFDAEAYRELDALANDGLAEITPRTGFQMRTYRLTPEGQALGEATLGRMPGGAQDFIVRACDFVRSTPFADLVSAIYKAYPEMRARSVFRDPR